MLRWLLGAQRATGIGRQLARVHARVDALQDDVGMALGELAPSKELEDVVAEFEGRRLHFKAAVAAIIAISWDRSPWRWK